MNSIVNQDRLNRKLRHSLPGRTFSDVPGSRWGEIIEPAPSEMRTRQSAKLSVLVFAAYSLGEKMLQTLLARENAFPADFNLIAVCTDDAVDEHAKLSMRKRLWRHFEPEARFEITAGIIETALQAGLTVYTGELKIDWFRRQLETWNPDLVLVLGCGQLFDEELLSVPKHGVINFHPADLPAGHGAGAQPFRDLQQRDDPWTRWTVHKMVTELDAGPPIGVSCPINIGDAQGHVSGTAFQYIDRVSECVSDLVEILIDAILETDGPVNTVDFEQRLPTSLVRRLAEPAF